MHPIKNNKLLYGLYITVVICALLFFQSIILVVTDPYVSLNNILTGFLFSLLQFFAALPAIFLLKNKALLQKKFIAVSMSIYIALFAIAIINLFVIATDQLAAGLPIVVIIWPLSLILTLAYAVISKLKK